MLIGFAELAFGSVVDCGLRNKSNPKSEMIIIAT
jgi:hypothetical protein